MAYQNLAAGLHSKCVAFDGPELIAEGEAGAIARIVKRRIEDKPHAQILIFDEETSHPVEIDFEQEEDALEGWIASWGPRSEQISPGPGRPKLGVVAREVTLLPRHWEWLTEQPGGASVALRKLVEEARKSPKDVARRAQESAYRFILTMAGDREGFEEASRALFAGDTGRFEAATATWPPDVRSYALRLVRNL